MLSDASAFILDREEALELDEMLSRKSSSWTLDALGLLETDQKYSHHKRGIKYNKHCDLETDSLLYIIQFSVIQNVASNEIFHPIA